MDCHLDGAMFSPDGWTWQDATYDPDTFAGAEVAGVTGYGSGFVAVGDVFDPDAGVAHAAVWMSDDGTSWRLATLAAADIGPVLVCEGAEPGFHGGLVQVVSSGTKLLAMGVALSGKDCAPDATTVLIASDDGQNWQPVEVAGLPDDAFAGFYSVVGGDEFLLLNVLAPAVWASVDGITWSASKRAEGKGSFVRGAIFHDGSKLVYGTRVGRRGGDEQLVWQSTDGTSWPLLSTTPVAAEGEGIAVVTDVDGTVIAVRSVDTIGGAYDVWAAQTSDDGINWSPPDTAPFNYLQAPLALLTNGESVLLYGLSVSNNNIMWQAPAN
jgi:hypothetical protein